MQSTSTSLHLRIPDKNSTFGGKAGKEQKASSQLHPARMIHSLNIHKLDNVILKERGLAHGRQSVFINSNIKMNIY